MPTATIHVQCLVLGLGVLAPACALDTDDSAIVVSPETSTGPTVGSYINSSGCSTAVVIGLSTQIAQEAGCENSGGWVSFAGAPGITLASNAVLPYLVKDARDDLEKVAVNNSLSVNSALRTLAQQYLLVQWFNARRCGITAAAPVGSSNHEGGRAVDLGNYSSRISAMKAHGWAHDVSNDPVHFDHTASTDDRSQDTRAFQTLWNANNPSDKIAVDGDYGPQTAARLKASPAAGFPIGASCMSGSGTSTHAIANVVSVDGPDTVPPQTTAHYTIVVKNDGDTDWPAGTMLELASGTSSPLYDPSWLSQTEITQLPADVFAGNAATIDIDVTTPAVTEDTPINEQLVLANAGTTLGSITIALTVSPSGTSSDDNEPGDGTEPQQISGGCNAGGGGAGGLLGLGLLGLVMRRRR
jgi:uncharacterized protein (TIGR03382 family)